MTAAENLITQNLGIWASAIKAKSSAGRGTSKKIELYGIKKLRELILELAVRGLLVPQDPTDAPASELLKKIAAVKAKLIKEDKIKQQKTLPPIGDDEKPFELPMGWEWVRLGEVTNYGFADKAEAKDVNETIWVLELEDVEKVTSRLLEKVRFKERAFKSSKNRFLKDDVIYGKLRPYLDKVLVADEDGVCTTEMVPVRGYSSILSGFLRLAMKAPNFVSYADNSTHGMNLPRMGTDKARLALIPLLSKEEQHRIVAKVDELMALCDKLEEQQEDSISAHESLVEILLAALNNASKKGEFETAWKRISEHFDTLFTTENSISQLKQTILQLAVMGKLVPHDPKDEPASGLLKKITAEKAKLIKEGKIKKQKLFSPIKDDEKPFELPRGWEWVRLDAIGHDWGQMTPDAKFTYIDVGSINKELGLISEPTILSARDAPSRARKIVKKGTVIYSTVRPYLLNIAVIDQQFDPTPIASTAFAIIHPFEGIDVSFVYRYLRSSAFIRYVENCQTGIAYPAINDKQFFSGVIPIPPTCEQRRIVAKVDELMALCDSLKEGIRLAQSTQLKITDSLAGQAIV